MRRVAINEAANSLSRTYELYSKYFMRAYVPHVCGHEALPEAERNSLLAAIALIVDSQFGVKPGKIPVPEQPSGEYAPSIDGLDGMSASGDVAELAIELARAALPPGVFEHYTDNSQNDGNVEFLRYMPTGWQAPWLVHQDEVA